MSKDKSSKDSSKKEKKEKRSEKDGVKKSKKDKKPKLDADKVAAEISKREEEGETEIAKIVVKDGELVLKPVGALVPFANPLADEKVAKKVLKGVKKAAKNKTLKRGVKEVVKALRKSPLGAPAASGSSIPGIVILAADISPMDVISHIPVLCEDHNVPYIFVTSRAELGAAGNTKRPTSVVMVSEKSGKKDEKPDEEFLDVYKDLLKVVEKEGRNVRI
ncbi:H/ACA ribonucleoprotein complex subunit [Lachnellula hyalina]|uniref:H/ACA ribonucleoprotein complex subunit 2 n=1 Tax=Lachnellula hyalina TaxID=1316788 RepID=A0A8H8R9M6_9HELO|nr:H/ACA ribonucleoprotein complex subunit [Lachnellula hyalina]TVY31141.1 H/ACA ribonucleoprotein complex subunit [Lachnellula hyalina]